VLRRREEVLELLKCHRLCLREPEASKATTLRHMVRY
jgi:hypothetical protein